MRGVSNAKSMDGTVNLTFLSLCTFLKPFKHNILTFFFCYLSKLECIKDTNTCGTLPFNDHKFTCFWETRKCKKKKNSLLTLNARNKMSMCYLHISDIADLLKFSRTTIFRVYWKRPKREKIEVKGSFCRWKSHGTGQRRMSRVWNATITQTDTCYCRGKLWFWVPKTLMLQQEMRHQLESSRVCLLLSNQVTLTIFCSYQLMF